jgi:hypothetical protein
LNICAVWNAGVYAGQWMRQSDFFPDVKNFFNIILRTRVLWMVLAVGKDMASNPALFWTSPDAIFCAE